MISLKKAGIVKIVTLSLCLWGSRHAKNLKLIVSLTLLFTFSILILKIHVSWGKQFLTSSVIILYFLSRHVTYFPTLPLCQFLLSISVTTLPEFTYENKSISIYWFIAPPNFVPCKYCNFFPHYVSRKLENFSHFAQSDICRKKHMRNFKFKPPLSPKLKFLFKLPVVSL